MKKITFPNFNYQHKNNKVRIIGIDPGLGRVGYGIIEIKNEKKIFLDCGVIETNKNKEEGDRLYEIFIDLTSCLLYTSPSPRDLSTSRMPSSA